MFAASVPVLSSPQKGQGGSGGPGGRGGDSAGSAMSLDAELNPAPGSSEKEERRRAKLVDMTKCAKAMQTIAPT
eukprot:14239745-Alexandrium_andersonii.AAC.1